MPTNSRIAALANIVAIAVTSIAYTATADERAPRWRVKDVDRASNTFVIEVRTTDLATNEYVTEATCIIQYYTRAGRRLGDRAHVYNVPIKAKVATKQTFEFAIESADAVKGIRMKWVVDTYGTMGYKKSKKSSLREGSTPPDDDM